MSKKINTLSDIQCDCGSKDIELSQNIGFDIWDGGEEYQHKAICKKCKKVAFVAEVHNWENNEISVHVHKWKETLMDSLGYGV
jgi:hypothetical protein